MSQKDVSTLIALARKGASVGEYMCENTGCKFIREYLEKNVKPDYSSIKSYILRGFSRNRSLIAMDKNFFGRYGRFAFSCQMRLLHNYAAVYDKSGNLILEYDSRYGWHQPSSDEEWKVHREMVEIYHAAYLESRDEMREQGFLTKDGVTLPGFDQTTGIEIPDVKFEAKA